MMTTQMFFFVPPFLSAYNTRWGYSCSSVVAYVLGFTGAYIAAARKIKIYDACTIISAF